MTETIQLLGDRVLVKLDAAESTTAGGLIIPDSAKKKPFRGQVVQIGPKVNANLPVGTPPFLQVGYHVNYAKDAGSDITLNGQLHTILHETQIMFATHD